MPSDPGALALWLDGTGFADVARSAGWVYPLANLVHLLGLVMLIGSIGLVDLRLLGAFPALSLPVLWRSLVPLSLMGFLLLLASGSVLLAADAPALARNPAFGWKLALIALAGLNALAAWLWFAPSRLDLDRPAPPALRALAALSLLLWLGVATAGRLIAYV